MVTVGSIPGKCLVLHIETDIEKINWTSQGSPAFIHIITEDHKEFFATPNQIKKVH